MTWGGIIPKEILAPRRDDELLYSPFPPASHKNMIPTINVAKNTYQGMAANILIKDWNAALTKFAYPNWITLLINKQMTLITTTTTPAKSKCSNLTIRRVRTKLVVASSIVAHFRSPYKENDLHLNYSTTVQNSIQ